MNFKSLFVIFLIISSVFVSTQAVDIKNEKEKQDAELLKIGYSDWTDACKYLGKDIALCLVYYQHCQWSKGHCKACCLSKINVFSRHRGYNSSEPELVFTSKGRVRGIVQDSHRVFYGIPFAKPPINNLRWENPRELKYWKYIKNTNQQKPQCSKTRICNSSSGDFCKLIDTSEDCLYLDVYTPRNANSDSKLPVIVYIPDYEGDNIRDLAIYDGVKFANSSIIFVKINYRMGVFGFLATDLLNGNFGILDQIKALEWVSENIESFGGDKDKVTIWGATSVSIHLVSPYSKSLFHAAIISSAPLAVGLKDRSKLRGLANRLVIKVSCRNIEDIDCLRSLSTDELLDAHEKMKSQLSSNILETFQIWTPMVDGNIISKQILEAVKEGEVHNVPIIIGSVQDEGIEFIYKLFDSSLGLANSKFKKRISPLNYSNYLSTIFPLTWKKVLSKYPIAAGCQDVRPVLSRIINDYIFKCSNRYFINKLLNQNSKSPISIYNYNYNHIKSISSSSLSIIKLCESHSCHGSDITSFFGSYKLGNGYIDYDEIKISNYLLTFISNFAKTHNPNQGDQIVSSIDWHSITQTNNKTLVISNEFELLDKASMDPNCDLFEILYSKIK